MINIRKLEAELWESADLLRQGSKLTSSQYCMPVLALLFLRYAYSRYKMVEAEILENRPSRGGRVMPVEPSDFAAKSALYLPREAQFDYLVNLPDNIVAAGLKTKDGQAINSLGEAVNNAMQLVEDQSEQLTGVLPKTYTMFADDLLRELLRIFNNKTIDKKELIKHVLDTIAAATAFLKEHDFELDDLIIAESFYKLSLLKKAANAMCETAEIRKSYCTFASTLLKLWKYLDREDITPEIKKQKDAIEAIYKELQQKHKHADITDLSVAINEIVNEHLEVDGKAIMAAESWRFDISGIDFYLLRREFAKSQEKNLVMKDIQELLQERIARMLAENPSRINFYEKYQEIIRDYNQEQDRGTIEKAFTDLIRLSHELTVEEKRYIREGFENDEQLSMYDVLMKDNLSKEDIKKLKVVAKELLEKIKAQLTTMDHPFDKQETRASIIITIRDILWKELPESYSDESINYYRDAVYNYVSQHYGSVA